MPATHHDLPFVLRAEHDADARRFVVVWPREMHVAAMRDPDQRHLVVRDGGRRAGFVLLAGLRNEHRSVELRRIVISPRGEGIGLRAIEQVLRWLFVERGAHRVWLDVMVGNARARRVYAKAGLVEEGVLRDAVLADGRFESLVVMSILRPEWAARHAVGPGRQT